MQAFRIAFTQSTTVITNYFNDQLKNEIDRGEKVLNGTMTRDQADREEEKWRQVCRAFFVIDSVYKSFFFSVAIDFCTSLFCKRHELKRVNRPLLKSEFALS